MVLNKSSLPMYLLTDTILLEIIPQYFRNTKIREIRRFAVGGQCNPLNTTCLNLVSFRLEKIASGKSVFILAQCMLFSSSMLYYKEFRHLLCYQKTVIYCVLGQYSLIEVWLLGCVNFPIYLKYPYKTFFLSKFKIPLNISLI